MPRLRPRVDPIPVNELMALPEGAPAPATLPDYLDKVISYVPTEVVAAYVASTGILAGVKDRGPAIDWLWLAFIALMAGCWTAVATRDKDKNEPVAWFQTIIAVIALLVWAFALGGPFATLAWYDKLYGSLLLIAFSLVVPPLQRIVHR